MAYRTVGNKSSPNAGTNRVWEDLRKEARKLEGEMDVKLAAYAKLCTGFEASYRHKGSEHIATDQLAQVKAAEIEALLQRLSDVNDEMGGTIGGISDARSHTLARHRDILQEFTQEFRRLDASLRAARERAELLGGGNGSDGLPLLGIHVQGGTTSALLRERGTIGNSSSYVDDMLAQAQSVSRSLLEQRRVFDSVQDKLLSVGERFPAVNGLLNAIRRKKSKDTLVLSAVIAGCVVFTFIYLFAR